MRCIVGQEVAPAGKGELDLAVVHLGDQGTSALAGGHNLAPDDLEQRVKHEIKFFLLGDHLDSVSSGPVPSSHVAVALGDG